MTTVTAVVLHVPYTFAGKSMCAKGEPCTWLDMTEVGRSCKDTEAENVMMGCWSELDDS